MLKKLLFHIVSTIHMFLFCISLYIMFFSQNILYNFIIYFYIFLISIGWLIFNSCILTSLENYLNNNKYISFVSMLTSLFNINNPYIFIIGLFILIFIILSIKLYFLNKNNKKLNIR